VLLAVGDEQQGEAIQPVGAATPHASDSLWARHRRTPTTAT